MDKLAQEILHPFSCIFFSTEINKAVVNFSKPVLTFAGIRIKRKQKYFSFHFTWFKMIKAQSYWGPQNKSTKFLQWKVYHNSPVSCRIVMNVYNINVWMCTIRDECIVHHSLLRQVLNFSIMHYNEDRPADPQAHSLIKIKYLFTLNTIILILTFLEGFDCLPYLKLEIQSYLKLFPGRDLWCIGCYAGLNHLE